MWQPELMGTSGGKLLLLSTFSALSAKLAVNALLTYRCSCRYGFAAGQRFLGAEDAVALTGLSTGKAISDNFMLYSCRETRSGCEDSQSWESLRQGAGIILCNRMCCCDWKLIFDWR
jgi:hypothetical protein